jgi:hypothetical protein
LDMVSAQNATPHQLLCPLCPAHNARVQRREDRYDDHHHGGMGPVGKVAVVSAVARPGPAPVVAGMAVAHNAHEVCEPLMSQCVRLCARSVREARVRVVGSVCALQRLCVVPAAAVCRCRLGCVRW